MIRYSNSIKVQKKLKLLNLKKLILSIYLEDKYGNSILYKTMAGTWTVYKEIYMRT